MRDIRSDLHERATLIDEQIRAAYSHFEEWRPFCSERCRNEDLARWADGRYSVAGDPVPSADDPVPDPDTDD